MEARFDHLTSGPPSPRKPKPQGLTAKERRDQDFRIACGAFVKGAQKAGAKLYADIQEAEKLLAAETARGGDQALRLLNSADGDGWTALHWAADCGSVECCRVLLEAGARVDLRDGDGLTALAYAVICDRGDVVDLLVAHGADADVADDDGETPRTSASAEMRLRLTL